MDDTSFAGKLWILTASCLLNIYASGYINIMLQSLQGTVGIAENLHASTTLRIYRESKDQAELQTQPLDLQSLLEQKTISLLPLTDQILNRAACLAAKGCIDNGEAIALSLAWQYQGILITDDRYITTHFTNSDPSIPFVSTMDILRCWIDRKKPTMATIETVINNMRIYSLYHP